MTCPPLMVHDIPERLRRCVKTILQAASVMPEPRGSCCGVVRLLQPTHHLVHLGVVSVRGYASAQTLQHSAQGRVHSMHMVVLFQHCKDLSLGVIGRSATDAFGQSRCGETSFKAHMQLQGMDRAAPSFSRFVEPSPQRHGAKERCHQARMLAASTIETALTLHSGWRLIVVFGLQAMQHPGHDTSTYFA
jgi:hypothetical protein